MLRTRRIAGNGAIALLGFALAASLAVLCSFDLFVPSWVPRFNEPTRVALRMPASAQVVAMSADPLAPMVYQTTQMTIPPGTVINESLSAHRQAMAYERTRRPPELVSTVALVALYAGLCLMLATFIHRFGEPRLRLLRAQVGMVALVFGTMVVTKALLLFTGLPEYWSPVAAVPLWMTLAFGKRSALVISVMVALLASSLLRFDLVFFAVTLVRGITSTLWLRNTRKPGNLLITGLWAGIASAVLYVAIAASRDGGFDIIADLQRGEQSAIVACVGGGLFVALLVRVLRDQVERMLGRVPRDQLLELTDIEQPLLKRLAMHAPGTWEHSRAMANLAEAASSAIGADALLTRVGAYYHDMGKVVQPMYFVENQGTDPSPHADLPPEVSADAIMAHVVMGTQMLREAGLPETVVEFVYTHHGTQLVEYFWHKYLEQNEEPVLTKDHFRYPGMKPQTRETAILMLVDSIEAASRTVSPATKENFEEMIRRVFFTKLQAGQLDDSPLTMQDAHVLSDRMASALVNMYHGRIKYPWQRQAEAKPAQSFTTPRPSEVTPMREPPPEPPKDASPSQTESQPEANAS